MNDRVPSRAEIAKHLLRVRDAEKSFIDYIKLIHPEWEIPAFHREMADVLDRLERGRLLNQDGEPVYNVLINAPPRHAKSEYATRLFPAYYMARNPKRSVMSASYNSELATGFGGDVKDIITHPFTGQAFPDVAVRSDTRAKDHWELTAGGQYFGIGFGGTTTGRPANLLIIDDPVKSRSEAESATIRNKIWNDYTSSLITRREPVDGERPIQIVILTRWHPDDLGGRIMQMEDWKEGRWLHINFPAIREVATSEMIMRDSLPPDHPQYLPMSELKKLTSRRRYVPIVKEEALWEDHFPLEELKRQKRINERDFEALYMQRPYIEGGNLIKSTWWKYYSPSDKPAGFAATVIAVDTAFKKTETSDFSVALVLGLAHNGDIYILDLIRDRYEFPELKRQMIALNNIWRGRGLRALYIEDKASGQSLIQELKKESGMSVIAHKVVNDKVARLNAVTPLIEGGRVLLPSAAPWLDDFMLECTQFPSGAHDDQVDALSIGLDVISRVGLHDLDAFMAPIQLQSSLNQVVGKMSSDGSLNRMLGRGAGRRLMSQAWGE